MKAVSFSTFTRLVSLGVAISSVLVALVLARWSLHEPFNYDEAYNLQVVVNLANGKGYASFGALRDGANWLFDPHITTGPVALVPLAVVWKLFDGSLESIRVFMMAFDALYIAGLLVLSRVITGNILAGLISVAAVLSISSLSFGRVLGEVPACALTVWAVVFLLWGRLRTMALLLGFAVQLKTVFVAPALLIIASVFLYQTWVDGRLQIAKVITCIALFGLATALFEFFRFISIDNTTEYRQSIHDLLHFLRSQNVNTQGSWLDGTLLGGKISALYHMLPIWSWLVILASGVASKYVLSLRYNRQEVAAALKISRSGDMRNTAHSPNYHFTLACMLIAGLVVFMIWITQSVQVSARQALPFLLLVIPSTVIGLIDLTKRGAFKDKVTERAIYGFTVTSLATAFSLSAVANGQERVATAAGDELREEQLKVAELIRRAQPSSLYVVGWWQNPEIQLLSGITAIGTRGVGRQLMVLSDYQLMLSGSDRASELQRCSDVIYTSDLYTVCWMKSLSSLRQPFEVLEWGPKETAAGEPPNVQPDGGAGIWIAITAIDPEVFGKAELMIEGYPRFKADIHADGRLITTSLPSSLFKKPGTFELVLRRTATRDLYRIGEFTVK